MEHVVVTYESETKRLRFYADGVMVYEDTASGGDWSLEYPDFTKIARDGGVPVSHAEALIIDLKRKNAAAMAIVRAVAVRDPFQAHMGKGGGFRCIYCGAWSEIGQETHHNSRCQWAQARALLAAETGATREETRE